MSEALKVEFVNVDHETEEFYEVVTDEQTSDGHAYIVCEEDELSVDKGN